METRLAHPQLAHRERLGGHLALVHGQVDGLGQHHLAGVGEGGGAQGELDRVARDVVGFDDGRQWRVRASQLVRPLPPRKPAREFFTALCQRVELQPEQVLLVGDDMVNDYEGARASRLHAILVAPQSPIAPLVHIGRLIELLA